MALPHIADYSKRPKPVYKGIEEDAEKVDARRSLRNVRGRVQSFSGGSLNLDLALLDSFAALQVIAFPSFAVLSLVALGFWLYFTLATMGGNTLIASAWSICLIGGSYWLKKESGIYLRFRQQYEDISQSEDLNPKEWLSRFTRITILLAGIWACGVIFTLTTPTPIDERFFIGLSVLFSTLFFVYMSSLLNACRIGIALVVIAQIGIIALKPAILVDLIGPFAVITQLALILLVKTLYDVRKSAVVLTADKDGLIEELKLEKQRALVETQRAEDANASKGRFLATMSHELRTPMNAILGFSEVMVNEVFGAHSTPQYKEYAQDIHDSGQHLLTLINELLDLSKIEAGQYSLQEESCSLVEIAASCVRMMKMRAEAQGLIIEEKYENRLPQIWVDHKAIRQTILNLLSNAIKFTDRGGSITIRVGWTGSGGQYFAVRDTGQGIPEDEISTVLSSFGQGSQSSNTNEAGTGLGLPICKSLIELHGGKFTLQSKEGVGTELLATLPATRLIDAKSMRKKAG